MTEAWRGIDSASAESRLRGLRRRLAELDEALQGQQRILRDRPDSFAFRLSCKSLLELQGRLKGELISLVQHRDHETVKVALSGRAFLDHSASLAHLGTFLIRLQKLYSSVAQAITSGPTLRGPIAQAIRSATDLKLAAVYPSSFGMELRVPSQFDILGNSVAANALDSMFALLRAAEDEAKLSEISGEMGRRTAAHLTQVASSLRKEGTELAIWWTDYAGTQYTWESSTAATDRIINYYNTTTETRSETKRMVGLLVGASLLRNRFELLLQDRNTIQGKFIPSLVPAVARRFGQVCSATVDETEQLDKATGQRRTYYTLRELEPHSADK